jgi:hypothetical protein
VSQKLTVEASKNKQAKDEAITTIANKIPPYERVYEHIGHRAL